MFSYFHNRLAWYAALVAFSFFLQQGGWFRAWGVQPNLVLLAMVWALWSGASRIHFSVLIAVCAACGALFTPFWMYESAALVLALLCVHFAARWFTGNPHADFFIRIAFGTLLLHGILFAFNLSPFPYALVAYEGLSTLVLGAAVWILTFPIRTRFRSVA